MRFNYNFSIDSEGERSPFLSLQRDSGFGYSLGVAIECASDFVFVGMGRGLVEKHRSRRVSVEFIQSLCLVGQHEDIEA